MSDRAGPAPRSGSVADPTLRVLLVLAQSTGGIGRHVRFLAEQLPARGVAVTICAPEATVAALDLASAGAPVLPMPLGEAHPSAWRAARHQLRRAAAEADLVHAHGLRAGAQSAASLRSTPLVVSWHNAASGDRGKRLAHAALERFVARSSTLTLAASDDLAAAARRAGAREVRTDFVVAPTLPRSARSTTEIREGLRLDELGLGERALVGDRPIVLAVGRLSPQKRLDVLIQAASSWTSPGDPVVLIAGEGPLRWSLEAQIEASGAPVRLLGPRTDVGDLLAVASVVALPSEWEARALVAQEALRAGVPLVTTPVGGLPDLVRDAALWVPVGDSAGLRVAINALLREPERHRQLVQRGRARAHTWPTAGESIDVLVNEYLDLRSRFNL